MIFLLVFFFLFGLRSSVCLLILLILEYINEQIYYYNCCQGRKAEEQRANRLATELGQFRHEAEKRLQEKDEEIESIR